MKQKNFSSKLLSTINIVAAAVLANLADIAERIYPNR
jgi:hypothetical protein